MTGKKRFVLGLFAAGWLPIAGIFLYLTGLSFCWWGDCSSTAIVPDILEIVFYAGITLLGIGAIVFIVLLLNPRNKRTDWRCLKDALVLLAPLAILIFCLESGVAAIKNVQRSQEYTQATRYEALMEAAIERDDWPAFEEQLQACSGCNLYPVEKLSVEKQARQILTHFLRPADNGEYRCRPPEDADSSRHRKTKSDWDWQTWSRDESYCVHVFAAYRPETDTADYQWFRTLAALVDADTRRFLLRRAIDLDNTALLDILHEKGVALDARIDSRFPLEAAAEGYGCRPGDNAPKHASVDWLLAHGADPLKIDQQRFFFYALKHHRLDLADQLVRNGHAINKTQPDLINNALISGSPPASIFWLLQQGVPLLSEYDEKGQIPLFRFAQGGCGICMERRINGPIPAPDEEQLQQAEKLLHKLIRHSSEGINTKNDYSSHPIDSIPSRPAGSWCGLLFLKNGATLTNRGAAINLREDAKRSPDMQAYIARHPAIAAELARAEKPSDDDE